MPAIDRSRSQNTWKCPTFTFVRIANVISSNQHWGHPKTWLGEPGFGSPKYRFNGMNFIVLAHKHKETNRIVSVREHLGRRRCESATDARGSTGSAPHPNPG
jgi:hypothetical protein